MTCCLNFHLSSLYIRPRVPKDSMRLVGLYTHAFINMVSIMYGHSFVLKHKKNNYIVQPVIPCYYYQYSEWIISTKPHRWRNV